MKSLKGKITVTVIILLVVSVLTISITSRTIATKSMLNEVEFNLMNLSKNLGQTIDLLLNEKISSVTMIANNKDLGNPDIDRAVKHEILSRYQETVGGDLYDLILVNTDGRFIATSGDTARDDYSSTNWFIKASEQKDIYYEDRHSIDYGVYLIVVVAPVKDTAGNITGYLNGRVNIMGFMDTVLGDMHKNYENRGLVSSYPLIVDSSGIVLWHPDKSLIGELNLLERKDLLGEIGEMMTKGDGGIKNYDFQGLRKIMAFLPMDGYGNYQGLKWSFGITVEEAGLLKDINELGRNSLIMTALLIIIAGFTLWMIMRKSLNPLTIITEQAGDISNLDLSKEIPLGLLERKDEIGVLSKAFYNLQKKLREAIKTIQAFSIELEASSIEMTKVSEDSSTNMQEISAATQEISASLEEISASSEEISAASDNMNDSNLDLISKMKDGNNTAREIEKKASILKDEAEANGKKAMDKYNELDGRLKHSIDRAMVIDEISNMANQIEAISEQTNLLALNLLLKLQEPGSKVEDLLWWLKR